MSEPQITATVPWLDESREITQEQRSFLWRLLEDVRVDPDRTESLIAAAEDPSASEDYKTALKRIERLGNMWARWKTEREERHARLAAEADAQAPTVLADLTPEEIAFVVLFYRPGASRQWSDYQDMPHTLVEKRLIWSGWRPSGDHLGAAVYRLIKSSKTQGE
jgi:hypothetical protein